MILKAKERNCYQQKTTMVKIKRRLIKISEVLDNLKLKEKFNLRFFKKLIDKITINYRNKLLLKFKSWCSQNYCCGYQIMRFDI